MESRVRMTSGRETPRCVPTRSRLSDWSGLVASRLHLGEGGQIKKDMYKIRKSNDETRSHRFFFLPLCRVFCVRAPKSFFVFYPVCKRSRNIYFGLLAVSSAVPI